MALIRRMWKRRIRPGREADYKQRHDTIWLSVLQAMSRRGVRTMSIFRDGLDVVLYAEIDPGAAIAAGEPDTASGDAWADSMADILEPEAGGRHWLEPVFHFDAGGEQ